MGSHLGKWVLCPCQQCCQHLLREHSRMAPAPGLQSCCIATPPKALQSLLYQVWACLCLCRIHVHDYGRTYQ